MTTTLWLGAARPVSAAPSAPSYLIDFDGTVGVGVTYQELLDLLTTPGTPFSMSAWVVSQSVGINQSVLSARVASKTNIETPNEYLQFSHDNAAVMAPRSETPGVPTGQLVHIVAVYDGAGSAQVYTDATLGTGGLTGAQNTTGSQVNIGQRLTGGTSGYVGRIRDVRLWDRVLIQGEIDALFAAGTNGAALGDEYTLWNMSEGPGGKATAGLDPYVAVDSSAGNNHGTLVGYTDDTIREVATGWRDGQGLVLTASGSNYIALGAVPAFNFTGPFSVSMWYLWTPIGGNPTLVGAYDATGPFTGWGIRTHGTSEYLQLWTGAAWANSTNNSAASNRWQHAVVSFDGANVDFYFDGVFDSQRPQSAPASSGSNINIGALADGTTNWNGALSDVRFYGAALSAQDAATLFARGAGGATLGSELAQYALDYDCRVLDSAASKINYTAIDSAPAKNDGTLTGYTDQQIRDSRFPRAGTQGNPMILDSAGANNGVRAEAPAANRWESEVPPGSPRALSFFETSDDRGKPFAITPFNTSVFTGMSICVWVNRDGQSHSGIIGDIGVTNANGWLSIASDSQIRWDYSQSDFGTPLSTGWTHLALTRTANNSGWTVYVNGVLDTASILSHDLNLNAVLGRNYSAAQANDNTSDLYIYGATLTAGEVLWHATFGASGTAPSASPAHHWALDDGPLWPPLGPTNVNRLAEDTINGYHGALQNYSDARVSSWVSGQPLEFANTADALTNVKISDVGMPVGGAARTLSLKFQFNTAQDGLDEQPFLFSYGENAQAQRFALQYQNTDGGRFVLNMNGLSANRLWTPDDQPHTVTVVVPTSIHTDCLIYLDGGTAGQTFTGSGNINTVLNGDHRINTSNLTPNRSVASKLWDYRVYDRGLSAQEVADIHNENSPPIPEIIYMPLTDGAATNWEGGYLDFDGVTNRTSHATPTINASEFSMCAWFKTTNVALGTIMGTWGPTLPEQGWLMVTSSDDPRYVGIQAAKNTQQGTALRAYSPDVIVNDGDWHHAVIIYETGQETTFYVDGALRTTTTAFDSQPANDLNEGGPFNIGAVSNPSSYIDGEICDAQIFNRRLTPDEVASIYTNGRVGDPAPAGFVSVYSNGEPVTSNGQRVYTAGTKATEVSNQAGWWKLNGAPEVGYHGRTALTWVQDDA